jgi:hypothetical protein
MFFLICAISRDMCVNLESALAAKACLDEG